MGIGNYADAALRSPRFASSMTVSLSSHAPLLGLRLRPEPLLLRARRAGKSCALSPGLLSKCLTQNEMTRRLSKMPETRARSTCPRNVSLRGGRSELRCRSGRGWGTGTAPLPPAVGRARPALPPRLPTRGPGFTLPTGRPGKCA